MKHTKFPILINFPTNIGDVCMALPAVERVMYNYPNFSITAIASPASAPLIESITYIDTILIFKKNATLSQKWLFAWNLRKKFSLVVDLKNSLMPLIIGGKRTPFIRFIPHNMHIRDKHITVIKNVAPRIPPSDAIAFKRVKTPHNISLLAQNMSPCIFLGCRSLSDAKSYPQPLAAQLIQQLTQYYPVAIPGLEHERSWYGTILSLPGVTDLIGKTTLAELAWLIERYALCVIGVDSSILHLGCFLGIPALGLFGPTPVCRSKPWSAAAYALTNNACPRMPCDMALCTRDHACMNIQPEHIVEHMRKIVQKKGTV